MCYFPKDDFIYDHSKSRAENYQCLLKSVEEDADPNSLNVSWRNQATDFLNNRRRFYKGAHLDWNYTEMIRDLIDQGLVKLPISDVEVIFVEWAAGNLDNVKREFKYEKAWFDWDGKRWPGCDNEGKHGWSHWWNKRCDLQEAHMYNDSNREEYTPILQLPAPKTPEEQLQQAQDESKPENEVVQNTQVDDALKQHYISQQQSQQAQVQYGGNQFIVPGKAQEQNRPLIPNVDYVDPNYIPWWERELMIKEAMMGAHGREFLKQMGMIPEYQPAQYQTVPQVQTQPCHFTSPEQLINYIMYNQQPQPVYYDNNQLVSDVSELEGFIGVD